MNHHFPEKLQVIFGRRSIRAFQSDPVKDEELQLLLEAAMAAPSAVARDPWRFVVARKRETLNQIADILPYGQMLREAPLGVAVCGDLDAAHDRQLSYLLQDCSAAIENLLLAAHGLGLGACWLGVHPREERMRNLSALLGLPKNIIPVSCIAIGHASEQKAARTRFNPQHVFYEKWGQTGSV